jgi:hypothetical protein
MLKSQQAKFQKLQITRPNTACLVEDEANALKSQNAKNQN